MANFLIYGANGYTGSLIAREATRRGLRPVLAGRDAAAVAALGRELALEHRAFGLDDAVSLERGIADVAAVLNCAGPFVRTSHIVAAACLRSRAGHRGVADRWRAAGAAARLPR